MDTSNHQDNMLDPSVGLNFTWTFCGHHQGTFYPMRMLCCSHTKSEKELFLSPMQDNMDNRIISRGWM